jgi:hypothetical protein
LLFHRDLEALLFARGGIRAGGCHHRDAAVAQRAGILQMEARHFHRPGGHHAGSKRQRHDSGRAKERRGVIMVA